MIFTGNIVRKINLLNSSLEQLVAVTTPNKNKILLDVAIKLYDDEVSRYRWLEAKAIRVLNIVFFLAASTTTVLSWLLINHKYIFDKVSILLILPSSILALISILYVVKLLRTIDKPTLSISEVNISAANNDDEIYDDFYSGILEACNTAVMTYREINNEKAVNFHKAHDYLLWLMLSLYFFTAIVLFFGFLELSVF